MFLSIINFNILRLSIPCTVLLEGRGKSEDMRASKINCKFLILHSHEFIYKKAWGSVSKQSDPKRHFTSGLALAYYFFLWGSWGLGKKCDLLKLACLQSWGLNVSSWVFRLVVSVMMWSCLAWLCVSSDPSFTLILVTLELATVRMLACFLSLVSICTHISI